MGPFVPDLISNEMNLVVALFIGVAFGFVLEQAGFSSSRRLAGLFYGYDFTVLRVFFTAAITAMCGIILLGYFGLLDTEAIYINPLWLWPAIVGGAIMGVGFILGGYCPGTSICAAAIGKIDALFFVGGLFGGVFVFAEMFPKWQSFHLSSAMGPVRIYDSLGMSSGLFAIVLIVFAVAAFGATSWIEKRVSKDAPSRGFRFGPHAIAAGATILVGLVLISLPDRKEKIIERVSSAEYLAGHTVEYMTCDELAFRIVDFETNVKMIDVRAPAEFAEFRLPGEVNIQLNDLFGKEWQQLLSQRHVKKIVLANSEADAVTAFHVLEELGFHNIAVLQGGLDGFRNEIMSGKEFVGTGNRFDGDVAEFRIQAKSTIDDMIKAERDKPPVVEKAKKKIVGGC